MNPRRRRLARQRRKDRNWARTELRGHRVIFGKVDEAFLGRQAFENGTRHVPNAHALLRYFK